MPRAWSGAAPLEVVDGGDYELGTAYRANADITIEAVWVYAGAGENAIANRRARVWSTVGVQLGIATLDDDLPTGVTRYELDVPVEVLTGTQFVVSFMTGGDYSVTDAALVANVASADGNVTALGFANAVNGNGVFNGTPGSFPTTGSGPHHFYGPDFEYVLGTGGNTAPEITTLVAAADGLDVDVAVTYVDAEDLTGATATFDWGDGTTATTVAYPTVTASHTYAVGGTYAILCTVTDDGGATDVRAVPVRVVSPDPSVSPLDIVTITNALMSIPMRTGLFDQVNGHDASSEAAPGGLMCSLRFVDIRPAATSGLNLTSAVVNYAMDLTCIFESGSKDLIDPNLLYATEQVMKGIVGAFTLDGGARMVDVHNSEGGTPFAATGGFVKTEDGGMILRIVTITIPIIVNDVWEQVA